MGDFVLPSQALAKWQHGIDHFFTHLSWMTTTIRRYIASQQMRWRQKITGQVFVPTLWNVRTTGPCRLRELQCNSRWIPINFQQLTYIGRCRKLERENDSTAAQGRHTNKRTSNHTPILQLSAPPPAPTNQRTQQSWTRRWGENLIILLWQLDPGCERPSVAAGTLFQSFTLAFSVYSCRLRDRPLIKYTGPKKIFIFTPFIIRNTTLCSVNSW